MIAEKFLKLEYWWSEDETGWHWADCFTFKGYEYSYVHPIVLSLN